MTNEEIAVAIQNGETELYPTLWEQVRRLIRHKAERYAFRLELSGLRVDLDDLIQTAYFALVAAVGYYDPESGLSFLTYLDRPLRSAFQQAAGIRTSKRDALDVAVSLDTPVGEDGDSTAADLVADPSDEIATAENSVYIWELRKALSDALETLSERERQILTDRYLTGMSCGDLAKHRGVSRACIAQSVNQALDNLRWNSRVMKTLAEFMPEYKFDPYKASGYQVWRDTGLSVQDRAIAALLL